MKKAIVLSAALLLAGAALFAADDKKPAVKFSGMARAGYVFTFEDGDMNSTAWHGKDKEARLNFHVADAEGLWDINIKDLHGGLDGDDKLKAKLTIDLGKALEKAGVDLNGFGLKFNIGAMGNNSLLKAYDNASGDDRDNFKLYGEYLSALTASYDKVSVQLTVDPIHTEKGTEDVGTYTLDPETGKIKFTKTGTKEVKENKMGVAVSAKYADKDLGFAVAAGYAHNAAGFTDDGDDSNKDRVALGGKTYENGFDVSGSVDVAKMAGLDFQLGTGAVFGYMTDDAGDAMRVAADVSGGVDAVDGFVEYQFTQLKPDQGDDTDYHYLKGQVNLNFFADKGVSLDVYAADTDLANAGDYWLAGADVGYKLGGVTYKLKGEVGNDASADEVYFLLRPTVTINW